MNKKIKILKKILIIFCLSFIVINCHSPVEITISNPNNTYVPMIPSNVQVADTGLLGEYIQITGENLDSDILTFKFDESIAVFYQYDQDTVFVRVPREIERFNPIVTIYKTDNDSLIHSSNFSLKTPTISHPGNTEVMFSEYVWIYGENFDTSSSFITATLNDIDVPVYQATHDSIQISIPNNIGARIIDLKINAQLQDVVYNNIMRLKLPEITYAPQTTQVGGSMTLRGTNFNPETELGSFKINNEIDAYIDYIYNSDSLVLKTPYGPYEDFEIYKIEYETTGMQSEYTSPITITSDYILYTKNNPINFSSSVYNYNNKSYAFGRNEEYVDDVPLFFLYELDYNTRAWTRIDAVSFVTFSFNECITENGEFYVYTKKFNQTENSIHKINLNSFSIETITSPPNNTETRIAPAIFWSNNKLYFGKGRQGSGPLDDYHTDLYSFNTNSQTWSALSTDNSEFYANTSYSFQGNKYITSYRSDGMPSKDLKLFNSQNNSFTPVIDPSFYETENVFYYQNNLLRVTIIPSLEEARVYNYNEQIILDRINLQQIESASKFFAKDNKVFFFSKLMNDIYAPSQGFYLINPNISNQF